MTHITVTMKNECQTALIRAENGFYVEMTDLDNSYPVDQEAIFSCLFENRQEFGISDSSWITDDIDNADYPVCLQYIDFVSSFDVENSVVWIFGDERYGTGFRSYPDN